MKSRNFAHSLVPLLSFFFASIAIGGPMTVDRLEASVNSKIILLSDVATFRKTVSLRAQLDPLFAGTSVAAQGVGAKDSDIIDFLINEKLIVQQFPVTDAEVEQEINSIQASNKINRARLRAALTEQGYSFDDYFELIRISAAKRNLIDRDIRTKVAISEDDVKNYFYNHYSNSSQAMRTYRVKAISVSPSSYTNATAAKEIAQRALREIKGGEPFEEVAKRFSDGPTASSGGDLGMLSEDQMTPLIRNQLRKMKIGEVSGVIGDANSGFLILKLADVKADDSQRLDKVRDEIRGILAANEYQHQISLWLDRQRQSSFIHRVGRKPDSGT